MSAIDDKKKALAAKMFKALDKYGNHFDECPAYHNHKGDCTCGFTNTMKNIRKAVSK